MDNNLEYKDLSAKTRKGVPRKLKPFWNAELSAFWKLACQKERDYLHFKGRLTTRNQLHTAFREARNVFDRHYRKEKRNHFRQQQELLHSLHPGDPKQFWDAINKLGPGKATDMSHGVTLQDGSVSFSAHDVLNKWKTDFQSLFRPTCPANDDTLDDDSLNHIVARWENEYEEVQTRAVNTQPNIRREAQALNEDITLAETRKIIAGLGNNKATILDNIPNEILQNEYLLPLLHKLFSIMLQNIQCGPVNVAPVCDCTLS